MSYMTPLYHRYYALNKQRRVKMSELSCDTPFIGRNETHDLSLRLYQTIVTNHTSHITRVRSNLAEEQQNRAHSEYEYDTG